MPEGDTIHIAARSIGAVLAGRVPDEILTPHPRHRLERWPQRLAGRAVTAVDAHGKHLFVHFDGGLALHSHLRMTGAWTVGGIGQRWRRAARRAWLVMRSEDAEAVQFDGPVLELTTEPLLRVDPRIAALGPDILGERFDERAFISRLRRDDPARPIGDALLEQRTVAGIGNLWKAESCFAQGIDPWRPLRDVRDAEALELVRFARGGMRAAVDLGHRARPRAVHGRAGQPCRRCGATIRARGQWDHARITFWCPRCQR